MPAGWPAQVHPPGAPGHVRTVVGWLLEQCPADYQAHRALMSQPRALLWLAQLHVESQQAANVRARGAARAQLRELLDARAVEALLVTLDIEQARLMGRREACAIAGGACRARPAMVTLSRTRRPQAPG